jgi:hypothetical protein
MTEDEARDQLRRMVASDTFPKLDGYELTDLLRLGRRPDKWGVLDVGVPFPPDWVFPEDTLPGIGRTAANGEYPVWAPSTAYAAGAVVVPRRRNGHAYTAGGAGTSAAQDPAWPTADLGTVDDNDITWTETNVVIWQPTYDLNAAAAEGWRWKAAKVTDRVAFGSQGDNYNADQLYQHCIDMAKYYEGRSGPRSIKVLSPRIKPLDTSSLPRAN